MKNKKMKKGFVIGMSAMLLASMITPINTQAATWKQNKTGCWWEEDNGSYPVSTWKSIGGTWYYFDQNGYMKTGWLNDNGTWYYLGGTNDGSMKTGWQKVNGTWYYLIGSGAMATGWQIINGSWYYLDGSGAMHIGWLNDNGTWYYLGGANDGSMKTGWQQVNGTWYYMDASGKMAANTWIGDWYVDGSGAWTKTKQAGQWIKSGNRWWYRHGDGGYTTNGWEMINGTWYYFDGSGWRVTGWRQVNGTWYYMDASGAMVKNTWVGDYYLGSDGAMVTNTWIGQYYVDGSGKWVPNKQKEPAKQEPTKQETALQSISLNQTSLQMWVGGSETLEVNCTPSNTTVDKTVTWKSSNEKVATVKDGKVEAVGEGEAVITAEVAGKKASCIVKTEQYYHLTYHGNTDFLPVGGYGFLWIGGPDDLIAPYFEIYSLNEDIAMIDENGNLTGISEGTATIVVEGREKKGFITVEVKKHAEFQVAYFEQDTYSMKTGDKLQLEVNIVPDNTLIDKLPLWKSSDPTVAEVDGNGVVRAMGIGETRITCILTEHPLTSFGPEGTIPHYVTCTIKVDEVGNNTELEGIQWLYSYDGNKEEYVNVGDIITPNIKVYPVTYPYDLNDLELSIVESGQGYWDDFVAEEGIVEIIDGNRIKICKPGHARVKAVLNGKETSINLICK